MIRYKAITLFSVVPSGEFVGTKFRQNTCFSLPICGIMERVMKMDHEKDLPKRKEKIYGSRIMIIVLPVHIL